MIYWRDYMKNLRFTVIGGDDRSIKLAHSLLEDGKEVKIFGFDKAEEKLQIKESKNLYDAMKDAEVIIGPLPFTKDNKTIEAPFYSGEIYIDKIIKLLNKEQLFLGGKIDTENWLLAKKNNIPIEDYFKREEMQVLNAIPTAEGAIQIAMEEMPITIFDSNVIVLGFGRIGKVLSKILYGMGAKTYVAARKQSDISWIKSYGYNEVLFKELKEDLPKMDVIINTAPKVVLTEELLHVVNKNSLIIDLASKPGGVDFKKAEEMGVKVIWALGLPGKVAPITAARVIKDTIYNIIEELEG